MRAAHIYKGTVLAATLAVALSSCGCSSFWNRKMSEAAVREGGDRLHGGRYDAAVWHFTNGVKLDPGNPMAYSYRGAALVRMGKYTTAIKDLDKAIEMSPAFAESYFHRGEAYLGLGKLELAASDFTTAIALNPDNAKAYLRRASCYESMGRKEDALHDYKKVLAYPGGDDTARRRAGAIEAEMRKK